MEESPIFEVCIQPCVDQGMIDGDFDTLTSFMITSSNNEVISTVINGGSTDKNLEEDERSEKRPKMAFICEKCGFSCRARSAFLHHNAVQHSQSTPAYYCEYCTEKYPFKSKVYLLKHIRTIHLKCKTHVCKECNRTFSEYASLYYHRLSTHTDRSDYKFECPVCKQRFATKTTLELHRKKHEGVKRFKCDFCEKKFKRRGEINRHKIRYHSGDDGLPFICPTCGSVFLMSEYLDLHMKIHADKEYQCPTCGKRFSTSFCLRYHMTRYHPDFRMPPPGTVLRKVDLNQLQLDKNGLVINKK